MQKESISYHTQKKKIVKKLIKFVTHFYIILTLSACPLRRKRETVVPETRQRRYEKSWTYFNFIFYQILHTASRNSLHNSLADKNIF